MDAKKIMGNYAGGGREAIGVLIAQMVPFEKTISALKYPL